MDIGVLSSHDYISGNPDLSWGIWWCGADTVVLYSIRKTFYVYKAGVDERLRVRRGRNQGCGQIARTYGTFTLTHLILTANSYGTTKQRLLRE